ncbi:hypothetical protein VPHK460_0031 [Vibrio phage K460]
MSDAEFIEWLRFWLSLDESTISDEDLQRILDSVQETHPDATDCAIKYYFAKATLEHLIRADAQGQSGGGGTLKKRREKIKNREIELEYHDSGTASVGWEKTLDDLVSDPNSIGCDPFPSTDEDSGSGAVIIGVTTDKYTFSSPYRQNLNMYSKSSNPWKY